LQMHVHLIASAPHCSVFLLFSHMRWTSHRVSMPKPRNEPKAKPRVVMLVIACVPHITIDTLSLCMRRASVGTFFFSQAWIYRMSLSHTCAAILTRNLYVCIKRSSLCVHCNQEKAGVGAFPHIHTYTNAHIHIHTHIQTHAHKTYINTHIHINYTHTHTYTYTYIHIHIYTSIHDKCGYFRPDVIWILHTHIHTHTHKYTHT
jgi:hypothetical protein